MKVLVSVIVALGALSGCSHLHRSADSGYAPAPEDVRYSDNSNRGIYDRQTRQTAYELGLDPGSLSGRDLQAVRERQQLRQLERSLSSRKEREQYSKILPWLKNDAEKIEVLSIPSIEGRQAWVNRNSVWNRSQAPQEEMKGLIESQDIAVGMPQDYVKRSWGDPMSVEVSGNPLYKNERWKYQKFVSAPEGYRKETRFVYFEGGRVVGWETE
ncbi:hypothetical protein [Bdellovibrio bacteriovorus]|uniref:Lipoprotein n=1 Tax=Bdellovibrio bacteriovorus str. Tiberius TaxID=1069642 RepID=K7YS94_BDEBC|nr:hypothetical protein [Bdellovibrio bacteriovorus]AFY00468.1 hypothetical protein Bdt_0761 [Bdellovibrio bacteriovorus str. Tiberius]